MCVCVCVCVFVCVCVCVCVCVSIFIGLGVRDNPWLTPAMAWQNPSAVPEDQERN